MANLISAFSFVEFMGNVWDALTSKITLIVYSALILIMILVIVIRVVVSEHKRVAEIEESEKRRQEVRENEQLESVKAELNKKMNKISTDIAAVKRSVVYGQYGGVPAAGMPNGAPARASGEGTDAADEEVNEGGSRFYMLTEIDKEYETYVRPAYDDDITLKELCEEFRNFSAGKLKLYYDIEDIRRFIGALAVTKLIILQGMSGTGKTSLAYAFGEFLENKTVIVPIQPMWKERTDLVG